MSRSSFTPPAPASPEHGNEEVIKTKRACPAKASSSPPYVQREGRRLENGWKVNQWFSKEDLKNLRLQPSVISAVPEVREIVDETPA